MNYLKPYPAYKDSGVPWLGEVPEHWDIRRLRNIVQMLVSSVDKHVKEGEIPVRLCNYIDVYKNERITQKLNFMHASASLEEIIRLNIQVGDVVITKDSEDWNDIGVPSLVEYSSSDLVCGYHLAILRPRKGISGEFLLRVLQNRNTSYQFSVAANGVTRYGLSHNAIKDVSITVPPLPEQAAIVRYLDYMDRRIRRYINAKKKLIALLNEQKKAIIHKAVTHGLDTDVRLKPSGVEWLGDVPEHWEVRRLKYLASIKTGGKDTVNRIDDGKYPFFVRSQKIERINSFSYDGEAVLTAGDGAGVAKVFHYIDGKFDYHQRVYKFSDFIRIIGKFFFYYFKTNLRFEALDASAKSTVDSLRLPLLQNFAVTLPEMEEQKAIVSWIEFESEPFDIAIDHAQREIALLREYRTRLIADVVTGKLDVREATASLPEEAEEEPLEEIEEAESLNDNGTVVEDGEEALTGMTDDY